MRQLMTVLLATLTFSFSAYANDFAVVLGTRTNSWDYSPSGQGTSGSGTAGMQAGVLGFVDLGQALSLRTGFVYTQRVFTVTTTGVPTFEYALTYFDVPAGVLYKFSDFGGAFAGIDIALNSGKSCTGTGCTTDGVKSSLVGLQFGASFKFAPQFGAELYYEMIPGDIQTLSSTTGASGKEARSVAANLLITFE